LSRSAVSALSAVNLSVNDPDAGSLPPVPARHPAPGGDFPHHVGIGMMARLGSAAPRLTPRFRGADIVRMAVRLLPGPFTLDTYHRLGELGIFHEDDRVELLDGQIVQMTPIGGRHAACVIRVSDLLSRRVDRETTVSVQNPLVLAERWEPKPDIAVLRRPGGLAGAWLPNARDVLLIVEVADTLLERDRDIKIPRYAEAGVPEAWLVDLTADHLDAHRKPLGGEYTEVIRLARGDLVRPAALPDIEVSVSEILG
jgi:Uma2 family endonuclease